MNKEASLPRKFYLRDANIVARELLGKLLVHKTDEGVCSGMIVEVEAYNGYCDKAAHSYFNRRTRRTEIQFGDGGFAYVYAIYGMHFCFNVVSNTTDKPEVVLVRALEPVDGIDLMTERRKTDDIYALCSGPGKLCKAMGITKEQYGMDLCASELCIKDFRQISDEEVDTSKRINIDYAEECRDYLWRYYVKGNPHLSVK